MARHGKSHRIRLYAEQAGRCAYCTHETMLEPRLPNSMTVDHIIPKAVGGSNRAVNLVGACYACNRAKGRMTGAEFVAAHPHLRSVGPGSTVGQARRAGAVQALNAAGVPVATFYPKAKEPKKRHPDPIPTPAHYLAALDKMTFNK